MPAQTLWHVVAFDATDRMSYAYEACPKAVWRFMWHLIRLVTRGHVSREVLCRIEVHTGPLDAPTTAVPMYAFPEER